MQGPADRLHALANRSVTYVPCADGEWVSGVQLTSDGADHNTEVVNEVPVAGKHHVDGHGQGDISSLAVHDIVDARLHGPLPELFVLTIVLGAFGIGRRFPISAALFQENIHGVIMLHRARPADELANAFNHALNLPPPPVGLERPPEIPGETLRSVNDCAVACAIAPNLQAIIDAWPELNESTKAGIVAMVRAAGG